MAGKRARNHYKVMNAQTASHLRTATQLADLLENRFRVLGLRFGLDPVLGIIPGAGDVITLGLASYILWIGSQMGLPRHRLLEMAGNIVLDFIIGLVPFLGDIADFGFKANTRNLEIIKRHASGAGPAVTR